MHFGECWAFQYGAGCRDGIECRYVEDHQCALCGLDHATRWHPKKGQNKGTPVFVSSKPSTATSSAEYQEAPAGPAGYQPVQYQPVQYQPVQEIRQVQYQPVQERQVQYKPVQEMLTQLALPEQPFQEEERGAEKKSSSHGRAGKK